MIRKVVEAQWYCCQSDVLFHDRKISWCVVIMEQIIFQIPRDGSVYSGHHRTGSEHLSSPVIFFQTELVISSMLAIKQHLQHHVLLWMTCLWGNSIIASTDSLFFRSLTAHDLFPSVKPFLKGQNFQCAEEVKAAENIGWQQKTLWSASSSIMTTKEMCNSILLQCVL